MDISPRLNYGISAFKVPEAKEKAEQILKAVQGLDIYAAISLIEWCSRKLLEQKCEISPEFLQAVLE